MCFSHCERDGLGALTSLKDPGRWYAVRSRISDMGFLCTTKGGKGWFWTFSEERWAAGRGGVKKKKTKNAGRRERKKRRENRPNG